MRPRIAIIGTGGTISSLAASETDYVDYPETGQKLSVDQIIARIPQLSDHADLVPVPFREVSSSAIGPQDWLRLAAVIETVLSDDPAISGVVILHGTATLEETAYFLNLTLKSSQPVVLVGAQRPLNTIGTDAVANAIAALRAAGHPQSAGRGVLIVLNDEIHAAREAAKGSTYRLHAFHSGAFGPMGTVDPDGVIYSRRPERPHTAATPFRVTGETSLPRVDILYAHAGADEVMVNAALAAGARGLVSAGFAPGLCSPLERRALVQAAEAGAVVVQASRVGSGRVSRRGWLRQQGWVAGGDLSPHKARILLMLALAHDASVDFVQDCFDRY
ncbi:MAG: asparaginase [Pseudorhodobacter sp.]